MSRNALALIIIAATAILAVVMITTSRHQVTTVIPNPQPTPPATAIYDGHTFDCAQVAQLVSQGEWYTPDGYHIPAALLLDCDI